MEKSVSRVQMWKRVGQASAGFLCSIICVAGYYPLLPSLYAAASLWKSRSFFLYAGIAAGIAYGMNVTLACKYLMLLLGIGVGIRFYRWANQRCGGITAGVIAGICTTAMNLSGCVMSWEYRSQILFGLSEGVVVAGCSALIYYMLELFRELHELSDETTRRPTKPTYSRVAVQDRRMEALVAAVDGLSEVFSASGRERETEQTEEIGVIEQELTGKLCASCDGCAICWNEDRVDLMQNIRRMLADVFAHHSQEEILRKQYIKECTRYPAMVDEAMQAFGRMELNRAWYHRLLENRQVIAQQFDAIVELMEDWSKGERILDDKYSFLLARIYLETKERGLVARDVHIYEDEEGRKYIRACLSSKWNGGIPSKNYRRALEKVMHSSLRLERNAPSVISREWIKITAYEDPAFFTMPGIAMQKKDTSSISGDNFTMFDLDDGHHYIGLSDGMGSGSRANQESEMVVDLLERLIQAGFRKEAAIRMMNSAMVMQGDNQSFSTLDLAAFDLYNGQLSMIKIGAAASFIKHKDTVTCLKSTSLPAGASVSMNPKTVHQTLENGDFLVMVTDGVIEYLQVKDPYALFMDMIQKCDSQNAGVLAQSLLDQVLLHTGGYAQDDMTILVTGIWKKG